MSLKEGKAEVILGIFFTVIGILCLTVIIPNQIKFVENAYPQPRFFPNLICALSTVLGIALFVGGLRKSKANSDNQEEYTFRAHEVKLVLITLGIMILYVISMYFIPYLPATIIATGALIAIYGQKKIWKILLAAILVPVLIYIGLTYGLQIRLP